MGSTPKGVPKAKGKADAAATAKGGVGRGAGGAPADMVPDVEDEFQKDELTSAHTWKPIKRSFLRSSPLENSGVYLLSELPMPVLHMEFDWAVKKKNVRLFIWVLMSLFVVVLELELAFDREIAKYTMQNRCEILKGVNSFITTMLLYYLYDYYDYQVAGAKKEWYKALYDGENPGPMPAFSSYLPTFLIEFCLIAMHAVPYADFRYWKDATGIEKPFITDKLNALCLLRLYTIIRVVRDYTPIYSRRRLVYDGGYRERGGPEINYKLAMKANMTLHEGVFVACTYFTSLIVLGYIYHCCERDWQPEAFTFENCIWLTAFQFAAMDFNAMAPMSDYGTFVAVMVIVWGLIILSMLVNVIFNIVVLTAYEGWAIDWLDQYELCEDERQAAADLLSHWWTKKMEIKTKGEVHDDGSSEAAYLIRLVQSYKKMREITYLINRNNPESNTDAMTELQFNMKSDLRSLGDSLLGAEDTGMVYDDAPQESNDSQSLLQPSGSVHDQAAILATRVQAMEEVQTQVLSKVEQLYEKTKGSPPP